MNSTVVDSLVRTPLSYPIYHVPRKELVEGIPDSVLSIIAPFASYWIMSFIFSALDTLELPFFEKYRIHESDEVAKRNRVTRWEVVYMVLLQQVLQTGLGLTFLSDDPLRSESGHVAAMRWYATWIEWAARKTLGSKTGSHLLAEYGADLTQWLYWWGVPGFQFIFAFFVLDTWQYFLHRLFHVNKFLYRHIHSIHHRLYVPYAYGALYNHPLEGILLDSVGSLVAHVLSGMNIRQAVFLFGLSSAKTVDDHSGYSLPFDVLQLACSNNADYHDIHHQQFGIKKNFSQPWFTHWDIILGTRMTRSEAPKRYHSDKRDPAVPEVTSEKSKSD